MTGCGYYTIHTRFYTHIGDEPLPLQLGKFISTAGKSILNLVKLGGLVPKYRKMWKIQSCEVCARKSVTAF